MKKALLLTGLLLVLVAPMATAAGTSIAWGADCWGQLAVPTNLQTFACGSNTVPANWKMTSSYMVDEEVLVGAVDVFVEGVSETGAIPSWWLRAAAPDCNAGTGSYVISGTYAGASGACNDPFQGTGQGGGSYGYLVPGVQIQIEGIFAVVPSVAVPAATESFATTFTIKNSKTVGTGLCAGCNVGMVFGLYDVVLTLDGIGDVHLKDVFPGGNQCLVWQRGFGDQPCSAPVPTRNATWGQVKSLYR